MSETETKKPVATLIKVLPIKRKIAEDTTYDSLLIWYRDENGEKKMDFVDRAQVPFYLLKDTTSPEASTPPMFIEEDKVDKIETYSDMLYREVAVRTNSMAYYDRVLLTWGPNSSNMKNLLKNNLIYDADMDVTDRYIQKFNNEHEVDSKYKLYKCYFDIEVDLMPDGFKPNKNGTVGYIGFPDEEVAPCPVNIITLIDGKYNKIYTFALRNHLNGLEDEWEANYNDTKKQEILDMVEKRNGIKMNDIEIKFYNSEEEEIEAFFNKVHELNPDTMSGWNCGFDILTMMNRLVKLYNKKKEYKDAGIRGYDKMLETVCDTTLRYQKDHNGKTVEIPLKAYYKRKTDTNIIDRMDEFTITDSIFWIDQELLYANIRREAKESYSLDAIANEELGSEKLDYHAGYTIKNLPWKNYDMFLKYNIFDVVLLECLENKNLDIDMVQKLTDVTNTRKYKVFKKTISIKNFVSLYARKQHFVMNNNKNAKYGEDYEYYDENYLGKKQVVEEDPKYKELFAKKDNYGAYVGEPLLNDDCGLPDPSGKPSMYLYANVFDEDFSSLYPSIIQAFNLSPNCQLGKFFLLDSHIKDKLTDRGFDGLFITSKNDEGTGAESTNDVGPFLADFLESEDWTAIGEDYFDLPSAEDLIAELKEKEKTK